MRGLRAGRWGRERDGPGPAGGARAARRGPAGWDAGRRVDVALAAGLLVLGEVEVAMRGVAGDAVWAYALWAVAALAVLGRRRWPIAFAVWAAAVFAIGPIAELDPPAGAATALYQPLALFGLGTYVRDPRRAAVAAVLATAGMVLVMAALQAGGWTGVASLDHYVRATSILAAAAAGGVVLRDRTEALRRARERAAAAAAATGDAPSAVDRALGEERARIARELHAVVTGCVRSVLDEVGVVRSRLAAQTGAARAALLRAREASHQAMEEMRRMLALLRTDGGAPRPAMPRTGDGTAGDAARLARAANAGAAADAERIALLRTEAGALADTADLPASLDDLLARTPLGRDGAAVVRERGGAPADGPLPPAVLRALAALAALPGCRALLIERGHRRVRVRARLARPIQPVPLEALAERVRLAGGRLRVRRWARRRRLDVELRLTPPDAIAPPQRHTWQHWGPLLRRQGMPLLVLVVGVVESLLAYGKPPEFYGDASVPLRVAGAVAMAIAFVPRRRWPLLTIVAVGLLMVVRTAWLGDAFGLNLTAYLTAFLAGAYVRPTWLSAVAGVVPIASGVLAVVIAFDWNWELYPVNLLLFFVTMTSAAWLTGFGGRRRLAQADELHALTEAEERRAEQAIEAAVTAERLRVARELHDLVGHGLTSITLQSAVAAQLLDTRPAEAATAVDAVEAVGKEVLRELHQLLAALDGLREDEAPHLARLPDLVRRAEADGLAVRLELDGDVRRVPLGQGGAAYRIVQEALTNARKHGGAGDVTARVACHRDRVAIEVASRVEAIAAPLDGAWSGGHGLLGMRERVRVYDGQLVAGPAGDGDGWVVRAELPLA